MKLIDEVLKLDSTWNISIYIIVVLLISWLLSRLTRFLIVKYLKNSKSEKYKNTSLQFLKNSIKFFIGLFAFVYIIMTVPAFKSKATFIFSGAGILAAIIGFAAQAAISNLIAGAFIVVFKPFRVGDYIKLDENRIGIVEDITLRHTVINNFENKRLIIPNSIISTESILNHSIEDSYILSFNNFRVGILADLDLARRIIQEEARKLPYIITDYQPETHVVSKDEIEVRVVDINESFIHLRAYVWLNNPLEEFKMKCALKEAIHKRFVIEGVDLPIPRRIVIKDE